MPEQTDQQWHRHQCWKCSGRLPTFGLSAIHRLNVIERCFDALEGAHGVAFDMRRLPPPTKRRTHLSLGKMHLKLDPGPER